MPRAGLLRRCGQVARSHFHRCRSAKRSRLAVRNRYFYAASAVSLSVNVAADRASPRYGMAADRNPADSWFRRKTLWLSGADKVWSVNRNPIIYQIPTKNYLRLSDQSHCSATDLENTCPSFRRIPHRCQKNVRENDFHTYPVLRTDRNGSSNDQKPAPSYRAGVWMSCRGLEWSSADRFCGLRVVPFSVRRFGGVAAIFQAETRV